MTHNSNNYIERLVLLLASNQYFSEDAQPTTTRRKILSIPSARRYPASTVVRCPQHSW